MVLLIQIETIAHAETCSQIKFLRASWCAGDAIATQSQSDRSAMGVPDFRILPFSVQNTRPTASLPERLSRSAPSGMSFK